MTKRFSKKLTNLSWICALMVVLIHAGTYASNLPGAATQTIYGKNWATFLQLFFTEGICRAAVPLFFMMSGYLFYRNYEPTAVWHKKKILKRLRSNAIPYFFWGLAVIAFFAVAQAIPATSQYFASSERQISKFTVLQWLKVIFLEPINSPLWFLRDLIVFALLSPLFSVLCKKVPWLWLPLTAAWWIFGLPIAVVRVESVFFFSCGTVFALHGKERFEAIRIPKWSIAVLLSVWTLFLCGKAFYLIGIDSAVLINGDYDLIHDILSKVNAVFGGVTVWFAYDLFVKTGEKALPFSQYSFLMFVAHHLLIGILRKLIVKVLGISYINVTVAFFASFALTVFAVILIGAVLKKIVPKFYALITGGR